MNFRICLGVWEFRRGGEDFENKEGWSGKNWEFWEERVFEGLFFFIIPNLPNFENLKIVLEEGFWGHR